MRKTVISLLRRCSDRATMLAPHSSSPLPRCTPRDPSLCLSPARRASPRGRPALFPVFPQLPPSGSSSHGRDQAKVVADASLPCPAVPSRVKAAILSAAPSASSLPTESSGEALNRRRRPRFSARLSEHRRGRRGRLPSL